jgi:hypothetical protein
MVNLFKVRSSLLSYYFLTDLIFKDVDLTPLSRLCSVHFGADLFGPPEDRSRYVVCMLAQITSQEIQEVGVGFDALSVVEMQGADWNEMARILERPNFSGLKRVSIFGPP